MDLLSIANGLVLLSNKTLALPMMTKLYTTSPGISMVIPHYIKCRDFSIISTRCIALQALHTKDCVIQFIHHADATSDSMSMTTMYFGRTTDKAELI